MLSKDVLRNVEILYRSDNYHDFINIEYLTENTFDVKEHSCFICIKGNKFDSHELLHTFTIKPILIIANKQIKTDIPYVIVSDTLSVLPLICANFFENPTHHLDLIGITGTDGKTTTALIIKQLIDNFKSCAYIGTNGFMFQQIQLKNSLTTPKPNILQQFLSEVLKKKIPYATLEVSSQGLDLHRVDYLKFKVAVFTNLTHEHLDYHKTIENYFLSKLKLFQMLSEESYAVVNLDSEPYASKIMTETKAKVLTYGKHVDSDFRISHTKTTFKETTFDLILKDEIYKNIRLNLFGDYNVYNVTAALATCHALGFSLDNMIPKLQSLQEIDGRMHIVNCGQPFPVIIDFAHTPNALNSLLSNISQVKGKNLTVVFGSAGERDQSKRPLMGKVVDAYASNIILTSEDPKSEDTLDIISDITKGIKNVFKVSVIPNRKKAIIKALEMATHDDIVVITGKGNEKYEIFNGYIIEHNDIDIVENYLQDKYQEQYIYSIANM
ncbi:UDP-N-acetylmuramoyl-L-alanyl-D-glutamate--2,6-diaminopimelate ligase [Mycoplasmatota bacterium]|nr:UDP-N-acetylmuramoyl-L-alanyl-D-glutamate--2,6-diaminopimelate ligase [Mycoplasmatota bacterium]